MIETKAEEDFQIVLVLLVQNPLILNPMNNTLDNSEPISDESTSANIEDQEYTVRSSSIDIYRDGESIYHSTHSEQISDSENGDDVGNSHSSTDLSPEVHEPLVDCIFNLLEGNRLHMSHADGEELLELLRREGIPNSVLPYLSLSGNMLQSLPKECTQYTWEDGSHTRLTEDDIRCTICVQDFRRGHPVTRLPCYHEFHSDCLLLWFHINVSCPLCRHSF